MSILIISESIINNLLTAAGKLGENIDVLIIGNDTAENLAESVLDIAKNYSHILFPSNSFGKNLSPRIAAKLNSNQISEVCEIINYKTFKRPIYGGAAIATVESEDKIKVLNIRLSSFSAKNNITNINFIKVTEKKSNIKTCIISQKITKSTRPKLENAKIIVSGGRGLKSKENFHILEEFADKLNAAVGATRAAVDAGFISNDHQIGQTGKTVAPDLYIAMGISGAIQHLSGIKDSKIIVAINNDPNATIFQYADYGLVGDLFSVIKEIEYNLCDVF